MDSQTALITVVVPEYLVSLRTYYGYYVGADNCGGGDVYAFSAGAGSCEKWVLRDLNGGSLKNGDQVSLRAANGMYIAADDGGSSLVNANRTSAGPWETFTIGSAGGYPYINSYDNVQLLSNGSWDGKQYYVVAEGGGGGDVNCNRLTAAQWETFLLVIY